jgi:hypothetical protein
MQIQQTEAIKLSISDKYTITAYIDVTGPKSGRLTIVYGEAAWTTEWINLPCNVVHHVRSVQWERLYEDLQSVAQYQYNLREFIHMLQQALENYKAPYEK